MWSLSLTMEKNYNQENLDTLLGIWNEYQKKGEMGVDWYYEDFGEEVGKLIKEEKVSKQDVEELQRNGVPGFVIMEIGTHLLVGDSGLTLYEARDYGHRIELMVLSYVESTGGDVGSAFMDRMISEELNNDVDSIFNGTYDKEKLKQLDTLPSIDKWDLDGVTKKHAVEIYEKYYKPD